MSRSNGTKTCSFVELGNPKRRPTDRQCDCTQVNDVTAPKWYCNVRRLLRKLSGESVVRKGRKKKVQEILRKIEIKRCREIRNPDRIVCQKERSISSRSCSYESNIENTFLIPWIIVFTSSF